MFTPSGEYEIPEGTLVMPNLWAVHHDTRFWAEPETFNPDQFLEEKGGSSKPESFLPFGTGRRVCLGEAIAKPEVVLIFVCFLHRFRLEVPEGEKVDMSPEGGSSGITPKDFKLRFVER